ncbi:MAG: glycosyltransferase [Candidatus Kuenenia stuttgartiensis]|nr:glycosyltransferase [Candidatus Kuenenia stuttgartiensis]MCL4727002.1 glycosyltransferase [Candidatus Kuenenia stuttgartiensis]MCZ7562389.1 glycosyltransferase [Burkholderiales bacterium]
MINLKKKYSSAVRQNVHMWISKMQEVDIIVGIPCYNCEDTISHVVAVSAEGLKKYYPDKKCAVFVSDGGSLDDTREKAYSATIPDGIERRVTIYRGTPGKGTAFRAIFEVAQLLKADAIVVVDADLRSITPEWIKMLADPIINKQAGFVAPLYLRHKYDGTITNNIVYPLTRALYGEKIRQPIGGDFGFCGDLAAYYVNEDVWESDVARFGIDVWMTTTALNEGFKIVQAHLGTKVHNAKDPAADLGPMFQQVISTLYYLMSKYESKWKQAEKTVDIETVGITGEAAKVEPVSVNFTKLLAEFSDGFEQFEPFYEQILDAENFNRLYDISIDFNKTGEIHFPSDLWARILCDFAFTYNHWQRNRRRLVDMLTPLYFGRTASYCREVKEMDSTEAEDIIELQAMEFEKQKPYLIEKYKKE